MMKKGVSLRVEVYIEGEDAPANDFAQTGQRFLLQVLGAGVRDVGTAYLLGVKRIEPLEGSDADGDDDTDNTTDTSDNSQRTGFIASWSGGPAASAPSGAPGAGGAS